MTPLVTIDVPARLDAAAAPAFQTFALGLITAGTTRLVLDFSATSYLGSAGIRSLLLLHRALKAGHGRMVLLACRPAVAEVLRICGLSEDPPQVESIEAARHLI